MYSSVESFGQQLLRAPDHSEFHLPCLVEDEHGIRLLISVDLIPTVVWQSAVAQGAQGILRVSPAGFSFAPTDHFAKHRSENSFARAFEMADRHWMTVGWGLSYPALLQAWQDRYATTADPFAQLHTHTEFSAWDGYQTIEEYAQRLTEMGQRHLFVTDHGNCAGHPIAHKVAEEYGLHAGYGMEAYFVDDRFNREGNPYDYWHLMLWAQDDEGLRNLWGASTESYRDGYWKYPRLDWDTLRRFGSGLIVSTACLGGPLAQPFLHDQEERALTNLARLGEIFGDRLFMELQTTRLDEQVRVNHWLTDVSARTGVPLIVGVDAHYARKEQAADHHVWIAMQTREDASTETDLFSELDYYLHTIDEVRAALSYLSDDVVEKAIAATSAVAEGCTAEIRPQVATPVFSKPTSEHPDPTQHDKERMWDAICEGFQRRVVDKGLDPAPHLAKIEYETPLLFDKGFAGYYLITADFVNWAKRQEILVGPGRGSGGASEDAWLMGITELDPVQGNLLIDRFMTVGRKSLPDFDIDFPSSRAEEVIAYVQERWGREHVARVGSHMRIKNKSAFKDTQRTLASQLPGESFQWVVAISKLIDQAEASTAGLGLSWDELMDSVGELLDPFRERMPELFRLAEQFHLRLKAYGKHAAGIIIDPDNDLEAELPMRLGDESEDGTAPMVTQFDMEALEYLGKVKFDFLRLRNLDTIQVTIDQITADTGRRISPYDWASEEYSDPEVFEALSEGWTLGVFQIETPLGTRVTRQLKPRNRNDLTNIITIGRPGPLRSGLDQVYLRRRDGIEQVVYPDPRLESVLADTYGVMLYQEDIMNICKVLAGYSSDEADDVRKILGKKQVEKVEAAGRKFVERAVANGTERRVAVELWAQMAEFAKYCVTGDTEIWLASSDGRQSTKLTVEELERRINAPLHEPVNGRTKSGEEYRGPCVVCGTTEAPKWVRGACNACYVWRQKFQDVERGLYGLTVEADGRVRPCRVLMVHKHAPAEVFQVTLADGKSITATANHRHLTDQGPRRVDELLVGDRLLVDAGYEEHCYRDGEERTTVGDRLLAGAVNGSFGEENYGFIDGGFTRLMAWTATAPDRCQECGHDGSVHRLERAHLDGNRKNNDPANLRMLCVSCHKRHDYRYNGRQRRWGKGHPTEAVEIVDIQPMGAQPVYSVVMDDPHIWIANGIATLNSFNRAHAYAYATIGCWTAWLKTHYARQSLASSMATISKERIPQFVAEARRLGYTVLPPDINISKRGFAAEGLQIRYGFESLSGVGEAAATAIIEGQPYADYDDFLARKGPKANMGVVKKLVAIGAFDSLHPNRRALEASVIDVTSGDADRCLLFDPDFQNKHNALPCRFDWDNEPKKTGRSGKLLKNQPVPPTACRRKACRQYVPKPKTDFSHLPNYSDEEIRTREVEMLGVFLSSSPFDVIPAEVMAEFSTADDLAVMETGAYPIAAVVLSTRPDPKGRDFGFASLLTPSGEMSVILFARDWERLRPVMDKGVLGFGRVIKSADDRYRLDEFQPLT